MRIAGGQVHPGLFAIWKDPVVGFESLRWGRSRPSEHLHLALSGQQSDLAEACLYHSFQPHHELFDSVWRHHLP